MEGLLIAEILKTIAARLPSGRSSWRFPDAHTFILPLNKESVWLFNRPPNPRIALETGFPPATSTYSGFQDLLVAKASGQLMAIEQLKLDRVVKLHFGAGEGFVPTPPVTLIAELTGRNCNLILLDEHNKVLGAARDISSNLNRFRQIKAGITYQTPPPYDKLDPRTLNQDDLANALVGKTLKQIRSFVDGIGPSLAEALAITSGLSPSKTLEPRDIPVLFTKLQRLALEPTRVMQEALELPDIETLRKREDRASKLERLERVLNKEKKLLERRLSDILKAQEAASEAADLRNKADVLMAYQYQVPANASKVELTDFQDETFNLALDSKLSAVANAEQMYARAKKRLARAEQGLSRKVDLEKDLAELVALMDSLEDLPEKQLKVVFETHVPKDKKQVRMQPGIRYSGPDNYSVIVGRNSKENDIVTFKIGRSRDVWLHVQGYTGSHVIIQAANKEVPYNVILFAAQLAAAHSKAGQSDNVPVDYTVRKNVWKPKGAPAGAVHYTQQKTVYVTPNRRPETT